VSISHLRARAPGFLAGVLVSVLIDAALGVTLAPTRGDVFRYTVTLVAWTLATWGVIAFVRGWARAMPTEHPIGHLYRIDETDPGLHQHLPDGEWFGTRFVHAETCPVPGCVFVVLTRSQNPGSSTTRETHS
jgi:hypothetical protein